MKTSEENVTVWGIHCTIDEESMFHKKLKVGGDSPPFVSDSLIVKCGEQIVQLTQLREFLLPMLMNRQAKLR